MAQQSGLFELSIAGSASFDHACKCHQMSPGRLIIVKSDGLGEECTKRNKGLKVKRGMVTHTYNPSLWEAEAGGW